MVHLGQVTGIELYAQDAVVVREGGYTYAKPSPREKIHEFSEASRRRLAFVASNTEITFRTMVTLTYPREYPRDGERVKRDLRTFLTWLRRDTHGCEILWFLEFQKRGAPHVHVLIDYPLPRSRDGIKAFRWRVAATWYRVCGRLDAKHLAAGTRTERLRSSRGGAHYAVKYAMKMEQKHVPDDYTNVGRFWGHTKAVKPVPQAVIQCTEDDIRGILEEQPYAPRPDGLVWRVLYNRASCFRDHCHLGFDKDDDSGYHVTE